MFTLKYLHPYAFYLYYLIIIGIYAYSILGIASETFNFGRSTSEYLVLWLLIAVIHSAAFKGIGSLLLGINRGWTLETGLAGQHLLGQVFQPSVFGVFLVVSIYTFLRGRPFLAVVFLSIASLFHSTYLLCAAILTLAYMLCILREGRNIRKAIAVGALALSLVLPIVIYVYISFPVATPAIHARFESIFVDWGIPFHARPSYWFDAFSALQVAIVIIALYLLRKTRIFTLLAVSFLVGLALSVVQIITGNKTLALMFPWRVSTYLVPISSCLIIAWLVSLACERWATWIHSHRKLVRLAIAATALALFISGLFITYIKFKMAATSGEVAMMNFVLAHRQVGDVYLIPPDMDRFRIYTGTPVIADMKTHPGERRCPGIGMVRSHTTRSAVLPGARSSRVRGVKAGCVAVWRQPRHRRPAPLLHWRVMCKESTRTPNTPCTSLPPIHSSADMKILVVAPFYKPAYIYGGPVSSVSALCEAWYAPGRR